MTSLLATILATGCATTGAGSFCRIAEPIRVDAESLACMTRTVAGRIVAHNEIGRRLCGWH